MAAFLPDALSLRGEMSWCSEEEWGDYPFDILRISPLHAKYAEQLTHRDYLGTILGLGIERAKIGDILVDGTDAVVFVHRTLQSFFDGGIDQSPAYTGSGKKRFQERIFSMNPNMRKSGERWRLFVWTVCFRLHFLHHGQSFRVS